MQSHNDLNERIIDRQNSFYWRTDRNITQEEDSEIWNNKNRRITTDELLIRANKEMQDMVAFIKDVKEGDQTGLGSINLVRTGMLLDGKDIVIRAHPKGVNNGYFHVESVVADMLKKKGLPTYETYAIHDLVNENDIAFQVVEKLPGTALKIWLEKNPQDTDKLMYEVGKMLAQVHAIKVKGFGSFNNELAKQGKLEGIQENFENFILSNLSANLDVLIKMKCITEKQKENIISLYTNNPLLKCEQAVLVHNDFTDLNLLTDGEKITGILDFDECCASDPLCDIAYCMSIASKGIGKLLAGYFENQDKPENFEEKIKLYTLRYVISNTVQHLYRTEYTTETDFLNNLLNKGQNKILELLEYFNTNNNN